MRRLLFAAFTLFATSSLSAQGIVDWNIRLPAPQSGVMRKGEEGLILMHRPHLISPQKWTGGTLSFEWTPSLLPERAPDGFYGDILKVFLSSDGQFKKVRSYEVLQGLVVAFDVTNGLLSISTHDGDDYQQLKKTVLTSPITGTQRIEISDANGVIIVTVNGTKMLEAEIPKEARKGSVFGMYNREKVSNSQNHSLVDKVVYKP